MTLLKRFNCLVRGPLSHDKTERDGPEANAYLCISITVIIFISFSYADFDENMRCRFCDKACTCMTKLLKTE